MNIPEDETARWSAYYQQIHGRPPHKTLLHALEQFAAAPPSQPFAIDLGCGAGRDTLPLLQAGWRVLAVDAQPEAIRRLQADTPPELQPKLQTLVCSFEALPALPPADLVSASFSLPFCRPAHFAALWANVVQAVRVNGRFAGQLFGENDSWAAEPDKTIHTRSQVEALLQPFEIEFFEEEDEDGTTACGDEKHWHIFFIVARKRP